MNHAISKKIWALDYTMWFEGEVMQTQYSVLGYSINLYFHKHKLAIEVDELGHADRNLSNEIERQKVLEKELD